MSLNDLLDIVMGPGGTLAFALVVIYLVVISDRFVVAKAAYDREAARVDRYDEIVQRALQVEREGLLHDQQTTASLEKIVAQLQELRAAQALQIQREQWLRDRERERDERTGGA